MLRGAAVIQTRSARVRSRAASATSWPQLTFECTGNLWLINIFDSPFGPQSQYPNRLIFEVFFKRC